MDISIYPIIYCRTFHCSQGLSNTNSVAINILIDINFQFLCVLIKQPLHQMMRLCLVLQETTKLSSGKAISLCSSFTNEGEFLCSMSSSPVQCGLTTLDWFILDSSLQYVTGSTVTSWLYVFISFSKASLHILSP